jgi:uncharacterized membrane protein YfcA
MTGHDAILLAAAGLAGGIVNALAGGATLITFPAMLAAGLPPVLANASNAVAISPGHLIAALVDKARMPRLDRFLAAEILACGLGGLGGALLLLALPEHLFTAPLPALIAAATALFAAAPRLQAWSTARRADKAPSRAAPLAMLAGASVYGGFFGAGLGVILTAVQAIIEPGDIRAIKALKNLLAASVSVAATAIFIARGTVAWPQTLVMLAGALVGGFAGGHLIRVLPPSVVRWIVIVAGGAMAAIYARRYWF